MSRVADPGCLSRIRTDCFPARIPDPTTTKRGKKLSRCVTFFVALNLKKLKMIPFFNRYRKRFESNDKDFKYFNPQNLLKFPELYGLDPGSQKTHCGYSTGIKKAPDPQHWI
jgi:hypothetical protein